MNKLLKVKIRELRKKKGLTQSALSQTVGVTEETISNWENGKRGIEWIERVCKLCEALECSPRDLLDQMETSSNQAAFTLKGDETLDIGFSIIENFIRQHSTVKTTQSDWIAYVEKEINRLKDILDEEVIVEIEESGKVSFRSSLSLKVVSDVSNLA